MDAAQYRQHFEYAVARDFERDGVQADWAEQQPASWGSEKVTIGTGGILRSGAFSPDGELLALGVDSSVHVYQVETLSLVDILHGAASIIGHIEWKPAVIGSDHLLMGCWDSSGRAGPSLRLWHLDLGGHRAGPQVGASEMPGSTTIEGRIGGYRTIAFSSDGRSLVYLPCRSPEPGQSDVQVSINVWDVETGQDRLRLNGHEDRITWTGFSRDNKVLGSSSWDQTVKIWDPETGELLHSLGPTGGQNWKATFSPNSRLIAAGCGRRGAAVWVWDVGTGAVLKIVDDFPTWCRILAFSPDSINLAMGAQGGALRIMDTTSGKAEQNMRLKTGANLWPGFAEIDNIKWLNDGRKLVFTTGADSAVEIYDLSENRKWRCAPSKADTVDHVLLYDKILWNDSKKLLACLGGDGWARILCLLC